MLASASPRRRELLGQICRGFRILPSAIDEAPPPGPPADVVVALALAKARAVAGGVPDAVVLGADTLVAVDGEILGKPDGAAEAVRMLRSNGYAARHLTDGLPEWIAAGNRVESDGASIRTADR